MVVSDVGKLALIATFVVGLFVLVVTRTVEWGEAAPFFTLVAGYLFGNGAAAVRKAAPSPVVVANMHPDEIATIHGPLRAADTEPVAEGPDDAWPDPTDHQFFTDEEGSL